MFRTMSYAAAAVTVVGGLAVAAPAQAAQERPQPRHCVVTTDGRSLGCFASLADADRAGSTGRAPLLVLARLFDKSGWDSSGATLTIKASRACTTSTGNLDLGVTNLAAFGFGGKTSSFYTRNHCDMKGYTGTSFTGIGFARYQDADQQLIKFNNNIYSIKLS